MEVSINEEVTYQYYTIVSNESTEEQNSSGDGVLYVSLNNENGNTLEVANYTPSKGSLESMESVNNSHIDVEYPYNGKFLGTSALEDEHFEAIKPSLMSLNYNETDLIEEQYVDQETVIDSNLQLQEYSDDSSTTFNLFHFENPSLENDLRADTAGFKCVSEGCDKAYATSYHLLAHMRRHVDPKPFHCPIEGCIKKFSSNFNLNSHIKSHTGEKPYICNICSKAFKTPGEVSKHGRIHTGVKPFHCPIDGCNRSFASSNILKVHVRSHTGERPYVCTYPGCGKAFASSSNQKSHHRIHSGEKPFACTVEGCNKRFTEYPTMYKHMVSHRNQSYSKIESVLFTLDTSSNNGAVLENF